MLMLLKLEYILCDVRTWGGQQWKLDAYFYKINQFVVFLFC